MKEETTEINQIKDDKDLSKLLFFQVYVATNLFVINNDQIRTYIATRTFLYNLVN